MKQLIFFEKYVIIEPLLGDGCMKKSMNDFSISELKTIKNFVEKFDSIGDLEVVMFALICNKEEHPSLNMLYTIDMLNKQGEFSPYELEVLADNQIDNLNDLIEADLGTFKTTNEVRNHFDWVRKNYDASNLEKERSAKDEEAKQVYRNKR